MCGTRSSHWNATADAADGPAYGRPTGFRAGGLPGDGGTARAGATADDSPDVRIGDAERERAIAALGDHYATGRLTREELDERLDVAYQARTAADLRPLFTDLPGGAIAARTTPAAPSARTRGAHVGTHLSHPPSGFPWPLLLIVAVVLTIVTHTPFVLFVLGWFVLGRLFHGRSRRPARLSSS